MVDETLDRYGKRVGYSHEQLEKLRQGGHRIRHLNRTARAAPLYSIEVEVVQSRHCNSGHDKEMKSFDLEGFLKCQ